jgi:hypothetical protein
MHEASGLLAVLASFDREAKTIIGNIALDSPFSPFNRFAGREIDCFARAEIEGNVIGKLGRLLTEYRQRVLQDFVARGSSIDSPDTQGGVRRLEARFEERKREAIDFVNRLVLEHNRKVSLEAEAQAGIGSDQSKSPKSARKKKSTQSDEAREKLIGLLSLHHQYEHGGCLKLEPIGNNELARQAKVDKSTASVFFNKAFNHGKQGGHAKYKVLCQYPDRLVRALKRLRGGVLARRP